MQVGKDQGGVVEIDAQGQIVLVGHHVKGGAFDLLTGRRGGIEVDEIGLSCLFIQVLSHTHNIHSGTYLTAGDVTHCRWREWGGRGRSYHVPAFRSWSRTSGRYPWLSGPKIQRLPHRSSESPLPFLFPLPPADRDG